MNSGKMGLLWLPGLSLLGALIKHFGSESMLTGDTGHLQKYRWHLVSVTSFDAAVVVLVRCCGDPSPWSSGQVSSLGLNPVSLGASDPSLDHWNQLSQAQLHKDAAFTPFLHF